MKNIEVLSTLLKKDPEGDKLLRFLPDSVAREVKTDQGHFHPLKDISLRALFDKIDKSWYEERLTPFHRALFEETFPDPMRDHFLNLFFQELFEESLPLPLSFLPDHPLSYLAHASLEQLNKLCFYLGLFDLEVKNVLKGSVLVSLEKALEEDEVAFCRTMHAAFSLGPIGLNQWNEERESLRKVVFERGIYRLSLGICDAHPDLTWYVWHTFPKEISILLQKFPKPSMDSRTWGMILQQITMAWKNVCTVLS